jgi:hypothetical protein
MFFFFPGEILCDSVLLKESYIYFYIASYIFADFYIVSCIILQGLTLSKSH